MIDLIDNSLFLRYYWGVVNFRQHHMEKFFASLGLNTKEINVFLRMVELGAQPVSILAKHVGLARSTTYSLLEGLKEKGVTCEFERFGIKYVQALNIEELQLLLERQRVDLDRKEEALKLIETEYLSLQNHLSVSPKINLYEGFSEISNLFEAALRRKEFLAYFNAEAALKYMPEYVLKVPESAKETGKRARELVVRNDEGARYKRHTTARHQIRFLPEGFAFESDTIITEEAVYMIAYGENEISGIEIFQKSLAETQRTLFEYLWSQTE